MGKKITVDSATLVNKALEVIEAHFLFGLPYPAVQVVVHPQSVVHAFVEFVDGSVLAQVGFPTMELPILYALTHPERVPDRGAKRFDPVEAGPLTFEPVRPELYPAYALGRAAGEQGGTAPAAFNAANEVAVQLFLEGRLRVGQIAGPIVPARAIEGKSVPARLVVMLAGVTMNLVLAFAIYAGVAATIGSPQLATTQVDSVTASVLPAGAEGLAALRHGDRIVRLNGDTVRTWNDLIEGIVSGGTDLDFAVAGRTEPLHVHLGDVSLRARQQLAQALVRLEPPRLGLLEPGRPAIRAGLKPGDLILRANGDTIRSWNDVLHAVWNSPGKPIRFDVRRDTTVLRITVTPEPRTETDTASPRPHVYGATGAGPDPPPIHG